MINLSSEELRKIGVLNRKIAMELFNEEKNVNMYIDIYKRTGY